AGKLARYEHIGWKEWPHSRCWSFHSGVRPIGGSSSGSSRASWPEEATRAGRADTAVPVLPDPASIPGRDVGPRSVARRNRRSNRPYPWAVTLPGGEALAAGLHAIRLVAGNVGIRRIETAWAVGIAADWAYLVALLIAAYAAGGAFGVALLGVLRMIPPAIIAPFADVPARRFRGDRALLAVNLVRAGAATATALVLLSGGPPALAFALAGVGATAGAFVRPIQSALMPALARSPSELIGANVTSSLGEGAGGFVGPLLGGAIAVAAGPAAGCAVAAAAFVLAALVVIGIPFADEADARGGSLRATQAGVGGLAVARAVRALRA